MWLLHSFKPVPSSLQAGGGVGGFSVQCPWLDSQRGLILVEVIKLLLCAHDPAPLTCMMFS